MNSAGQPNGSRIPISFAEAEDVVIPFANAMFRARSAQVNWAQTPLAGRLKLIRRLRRLIAVHAPRLAAASADARQRPAREALTAEVFPLAEACRFLEREAGKILAPRRLGRRGLPLWLAGVESEIRREPLGVILIIGPGNYPLLLPGVQLIQSLVAGNAVILKPGVGGTAAACVLFDLLAEAGLDRRLVALLPESAAAAGTAILARPDKVIFTGSAATGEKILAQLAPQLIPATMELSGCDAVLVRADADLDLVVRALKFGLTLNAGATCLAPKRVFVHRGIATELEGRLANVFCRNRNAGTSTSTESRSFSASVAAEKLRPFLDDAVARGAHFIAGGIRDDGQIAVPLVLAGVAPESRLLREDIFAPVLAIVTVADDHEALQRINDCPFALGASIFSRDEADARLLAGRINAGVVSINDLIIPTADARLPFGGRKRSGFGLTRGAEGLLELTAAKVVTVSRGRFRPAFDESRPGDEELFHSYLQLAHGADWKARLAALFRLCKQILSRLKNSRLKL